MKKKRFSWGFQSPRHKPKSNSYNIFRRRHQNAGGPNYISFMTRVLLLSELYITYVKGGYKSLYKVGRRKVGFFPLSLSVYTTSYTYWTGLEEECQETWKREWESHRRIRFVLKRQRQTTKAVCFWRKVNFWEQYHLTFYADPVHKVSNLIAPCGISVVQCHIALKNVQKIKPRHFRNDYAAVGVLCEQNRSYRL